ncbi:hypothetical protein F5Y09DRAFT_322155 [Xylaria sp. FL1042]|nr:hypothetical protein F5Y09DRAFT_322155 [Xylaria sp. FL1042]
MNIWTKVSNCQSSCIVRREYALLFILNLNGVARLQMRFIEGFSGSESHDPNSLTKLYCVDGEQGYDLSALVPDETQLRPESHSTPLLFETTATGAGSPPIDDVLGHSSMLRELVHGQIGRLQSSIQFLRGEWIAAGLNDCTAKLDLVSLALDNQAALLHDKSAGLYDKV